MCPHGFDWPSICRECRKDSIEQDRRLVKEQGWVYAVIPWRGDGKYKIEDAVRAYKSKSAAEKYANRNEFCEWVVRLIPGKQSFKKESL